jgi:hypothetical protein
MSAQNDLFKMLEQMRDNVKLHPTLVYRYGWDFILQHGKFNEKIIPYPRHLFCGAQKKCFGNSMILSVLTGFKYIEGYALASVMPFPIHHAWNEDPEGNLIDSTWRNTGLAYCGVEFSVGRADEATWEGDASILNDYRRKYPLFQKRWTGEDFSIKWQQSKQLELLRARKFRELYFLVEQELDGNKEIAEESHGGPITATS